MGQEARFATGSPATHGYYSFRELSLTQQKEFVFVYVVTTLALSEGLPCFVTRPIVFHDLHCCEDYVYVSVDRILWLFESGLELIHKFGRPENIPADTNTMLARQCINASTTAEALLDRHHPSSHTPSTQVHSSLDVLRSYPTNPGCAPELSRSE